MSTATAVYKTLTVLLTGIAALSLLVGGIGVMNIMLVSVTERTREIGLRKALGAPPWAIRRQFLVEAGVLGLAGGVLGAALGIVAAQILPGLLDTSVVVSGAAVAGVRRRRHGHRPRLRRLPRHARRATGPHRRAARGVTPLSKELPMSIRPRTALALPAARRGHRARAQRLHRRHPTPASAAPSAAATHDARPPALRARRPGGGGASGEIASVTGTVMQLRSDGLADRGDLDRHHHVHRARSPARCPTSPSAPAWWRSSHRARTRPRRRPTTTPRPSRRRASGSRRPPTTARAPAASAAATSRRARRRPSRRRADGHAPSMPRRRPARPAPRPALPGRSRMRRSAAAPAARSPRSTASTLTVESTGPDDETTTRDGHGHRPRPPTRRPSPPTPPRSSSASARPRAARPTTAARSPRRRVSVSAPTDGECPPGSCSTAVPAAPPRRRGRSGRPAGRHDECLSRARPVRWPPVGGPVVVGSSRSAPPVRWSSWPPAAGSPSR